MDRKVIVYIAASVDGYIAAPGDDLSFLSLVEKTGEDYGYAAFIETVDTVVMGRKTYEWIMQQVPEYVHQEKENFVITRTPRPAEGKVHFYTGDLPQLVHDLKAKEGKTIFIDGGAEVVNTLLQQNLVDEIILSLVPVLLGDGVRLFQRGFPQQLLQLKQTKTFESGLVQLHFVCQHSGQHTSGQG